MKRLTALLCVLALLFLASCSGGGRVSVLTVNGSTDIDTEVFLYYLNNAFYGEAGRQSSAAVDIATSDSLRYVAVNTEFARRGMKLSADERAEVSLRANALWRMYGKYYEELGVSRDTFFKLMLHEAMRASLLTALYDTGGELEIPEEQLKQYFSQYYVGIKYYYEELYSPLSDEELAGMTNEQTDAYNAKKEEALNRYNYLTQLATYVNSGVYSIDEAYMAATGNVREGVGVDTTVVSSSDTEFNADFIRAVFSQSEGTAFIVTNDARSYVYFVERISLFDGGDELFESYRSRCLPALAENYFVNEIDSLASTYKAVRHTGAVSACLSSVRRIDRGDFAGTDEYTFRPIKG